VEVEIGKVKFFHEKKGWGIIEREGKEDAFVHYLDLPGDGFRTLFKDDIVLFEAVDGPKGVKAIKVEIFASSNSRSKSERT
jgi:CspA family cold shock protein